MRRQLPQISQRLAQSLDKLKRPQHESGQFVQASQWWKSLQRNYQHARVEFVPPEIDRDLPIPKGLFDSVADNLIANALQKRGVQPGLRIIASLSLAPRIEFTVCDEGAPVPAASLRDLLLGPVPSDSGLGIGLFQASEQAQAQGYVLQLRANREGQVCFVLQAEPPLSAAEQSPANKDNTGAT